MTTKSNEEIKGDNTLSIKERTTLTQCTNDVLLLEEVLAVTTSANEATQFQRLWHARLGHPSRAVMVKLARNLNLSIRDQEALYDCRLSKQLCLSCAKGKGYKLASTTKNRNRLFRRSPSQELLETIHIDTCGPITPVSSKGYQYFQLIVDGKTRYVTPVFPKKKSKGFDKFIAYKTRVENATGKKILNLQTDNGNEFVSSRTRKFFSDEEIRHVCLVPYKPAQSGLIERHIQTIVNKAKTRQTSSC